ncbi:phosphonate metabolism protein/1,5-bisphosphokinase (PRPP-forming) PhnN [Phyllobacterium salinisoli]|uniref:Ribose 1,5-bisphosphate phosphokinase PhnN n=1 Tax=Phyllobacterium salinisoli TaxID=1899321 RepID=A0A368K0J8_9HYPH|nr:phosphonate metabolism protein/1,5-bisphosphokinase (PRPP-forming) PhnN [Phyllobacterium salinisoli]RCS22926.1 phosphonate metabolism protein/1,5-bisphosphokinase (PRPP-forming) PhnN [Phyllobacterium salinisoli]
MPEAKPRVGTLLVVVGPSGVGKDSLIAYARQRLASNLSILFVRRVITRPALAYAEDHDTCSPEAFAAARAAGTFAVTWEAHGLNYGVPRETCAHLERGGVAVLNGSRAALRKIRSAFGGSTTVVRITCDPDILAARLAARRRESPAEIEQRLRRAAMVADDIGDAIEIDNSGELVLAGDILVSTIRGIAKSIGGYGDFVPASTGQAVKADT